jgi:hypothetical protein
MDSAKIVKIDRRSALTALALALSAVTIAREA